MLRIRSLAVALLVGGLVGSSLAADTKEIEAVKKALQEVGDFPGEWNGNGDTKISGKKGLWKESISWGWKFAKDGANTLKMDVKDGQFLKSGELTYLPEKKLYQFTVTDVAKKESVYTGKIEKGQLVLDRKESSGDVQRLKFYTLSDGARMMILAETQSKGKGLFSKQYQVSASNAAESFAGGGKKPECIVTGGAASIAVSFEGKTYYVCCSGCRDEFNAAPKKYVDEFLKKKK
jgi:YHS domain-containing protein